MTIVKRYTYKWTKGRALGIFPQKMCCVAEYFSWSTATISSFSKAGVMSGFSIRDLVGFCMTHSEEKADQ